MATMTQTSYAPHARVGLLISCFGFAALALSTAIPALAAAVGPVMGVGWVVVIITIVYVPRLIRPGRSWVRARLPRALATSVFVGSAVVALIAVTVHMSNGSSAWGYAATTAILGAALSAALAKPEGVRRTRS